MNIWINTAPNCWLEYAEQWFDFEMHVCSWYALFEAAAAGEI